MYYDMKKDNLTRKYRNYKIGFFTCFGMSFYFLLILLLPCCLVSFVVWMHYYSEDVLGNFITITERSLNNDQFYNKMEMIKFKMDKFISDFSGVSEPFKTSSNLTEFLSSINIILESRKNDTN